MDHTAHCLIEELFVYDEQDLSWINIRENLISHLI
jgi:hypothetical protein